MARPIRLEFPGALYHVMSRGVGGAPTYVDNEDRVRFLDAIGVLVDIGVLIVHSFCLMSNHFHLLCETPIGKLGRWMHQLLSKYSRDFNRRHSRSGHLWQARYRAIHVDSGEYLLDCSRYIHLNPVRAEVVCHAEEYVWSSYRGYLALDAVVDWVCSSRVLAEAGGADRYKAFVDAGLALNDQSPFERASGGAFFGSKEFVKQMRARIRQPKRPGDLSGYCTLHRQYFPPIELLRAAVDDVFPDCCQYRRRRILAFALRRIFLATGREIAQLIGRSEAMVSEACHEMENRIAIDAECGNRLNELYCRIRLISA